MGRGGGMTATARKKSLSTGVMCPYMHPPHRYVRSSRYADTQDHTKKVPLNEKLQPFPRIAYLRRMRTPTAVIAVATDARMGAMKEASPVCGKVLPETPGLPGFSGLP